jgi:hypothetical protein
MPDIFAPSYGPRPGSGESPFLQGIVVAWDSLAGTNVVRVRGRELENLQSMIGSESGMMRTGDSVVVGKLNNTYAVLGRLEPQGVPARALGLVSAEVSMLDNPTTNGFEARNAPFVDVHIGSSGRCMVTLSMEISITNNVQRLGVFVSGPSLIGPMDWRALTVGSVDDLEMQASRVLMFGPENGLTLNEGLTRFQVMAKTGNHLSSLPLVGEVQITVQPF